MAETAQAAPISRATIIARAPGRGADNVRLAALRALRTLLQGVGGAIPSAGVGTVILTTDYWTALGYSCLAALVAAAVSFVHNMASFLPEDPTRGPRRDAGS